VVIARIERCEAPVLGEAVCVADALPLPSPQQATSKTKYMNPLHHLDQALAHSGLHTTSSEATALQSAYFPYQPVHTPGTTPSHLLLDFAHAFDTRFGGLLSPPPVSAPVYSPGADGICLATPPSRLFREIRWIVVCVVE